MAMSMIPTSKVHPKFLKSNSTCHPWAFGAFAELIDNSYDAKARKVQIDQLILENFACLIIQDDGNGMDGDHIFKMLSFGVCERSRNAIGKYGNGFKSSSMRLGDDAIVFTKTKERAGIGFLSQTYNNYISADSIKVPMLDYSLPDLTSVDDDDAHKKNLEAILGHSPFKDEDALKNQLQQIKKTGTRIIIYNLVKISEGQYIELDFDTDPEDIRCPKIYVSESQLSSKYRSSLREYCSILYLCPRMKIKIRNTYVKTKFIVKSLINRLVDEYAPKGHRNFQITFGFMPDFENSEDYGMMLYTENRLVKPYERVSCQRKGNGEGAGVVGVIQASFLTPSQNKQDFVPDIKYIAAMKAFSTKLKEYWQDSQEKASTSTYKRSCPWVQCDLKKCLKWRRLPEETDISNLPDKWYCCLHPDNIDCQVQQDVYEEGEETTRAPARRRLRAKRKNIVQISELLNGKRGKQNYTPASLDSFTADESNDSELPLPVATTSRLRHSLSALDTTSNSSADPTVNTRMLRNSNKIPSPAIGVQRSQTVKTLVKRNSYQNRQKMVKTSVLRDDDSNAETSVDTVLEDDDNNAETSVDTVLEDDDNTKTSLGRRRRGNVNTTTSVDSRREIDNNTRTSLGRRRLGNNNTTTSVDSRREIDDNTKTSLGRRRRGNDNTTTSSGGRHEINNTIEFTDSRQETDETSFNSDHVSNGDHVSNATDVLSVDVSGHGTADSKLIEAINEIDALKLKLAVLEMRFNDLLNNSKQLLAMFAPEVPIAEGINIEVLIAEMVESGLDG